jgi:hypothetical protein
MAAKDSLFGVVWLVRVGQSALVAQRFDASGGPRTRHPSSFTSKDIEMVERLAQDVWTMHEQSIAAKLARFKYQFGPHKSNLINYLAYSLKYWHPCIL